MAERDDNDDTGVSSVTCHSYTHARRYPLVIGKIGGFALPSPLSPSQIATLLGSFFVMLVARRWWGFLLPGIADAVLLLLVPAAAAWAVRHLRMEGRSPVKMLMGLITLAAAPGRGTVRGRRVRSSGRPCRMLEPVYVVGDATAVGDAGLPARGPAPKGLTGPVVDIVAGSPWACLDMEEATGCVTRPSSSPTI